jgi:hypothetical protein
MKKFILLLGISAIFIVVGLFLRSLSLDKEIEISKQINTDTDKYFSSKAKIKNQDQISLPKKFEKNDIQSNQQMEHQAKKIAHLSNFELEAEIINGKLIIENENLIHRLNSQELSIPEIEKTQILFERMALLSLEHASRRQKELVPKLQQQMANIEHELTEIKHMLMK